MIDLTGKLLQLSSSRQSEIRTWYDESLYRRPDSGRSVSTASKVWKMELLVEQLRLLNDEVAEAAGEICGLHKRAEERAADERAEGIDGYPLDSVSLCEALMVSDDALRKMHSVLVNTFKSVSGVT